MNMSGEIQVQLHDPLGASTWYRFNKRMGGSQSRFERFGQQKIMSPYRESNHDSWALEPAA